MISKAVAYWDRNDSRNVGWAYRLYSADGNEESGAMVSTDSGDGVGAFWELELLVTARGGDWAAGSWTYHDHDGGSYVWEAGDDSDDGDDLCAEDADDDCDDDTTAAQAIANRMGNDGTHFEDADGVTLDEILVEYEASEDRYQSGGAQWRVYTLADSSRLVVSEAGWWDILDESGLIEGERFDDDDDWQSCCMDVSQRRVSP